MGVLPEPNHIKHLYANNNFQKQFIGFVMGGCSNFNTLKTARFIHA